MVHDSGNSVSVLVVDDEPSMLRAWEKILAGARYELTLTSDPLQAVQLLDDLELDVAVIDYRMPVMDGLELLSVIKSKRPEVEVVMMTAFGGVENAVQAIKRGAYDYLSKPFDNIEAAELTVIRAAERRHLERRLRQLEREQQGEAVSQIVGQSPAIKKVIERIKSVASSPVTVLISGESGTGKELVAHAIHRASPRAKQRLVTVNCSALTESLLESELFGHAKGAFTGASSSHKGLFAAAHGGTIFLDEIGDMALSTQVKLLRTLQDGEVRPIGSTEHINVDVRVIAATNKSLEQAAHEGAFRTDLYYRLNVVGIDVPPLRERGSDIALLAYHLLRHYERKMNKRFEAIDREALERLLRHDWPGNVRQLGNVIEQAVVLSCGRSIGVDDLPEELIGDRDSAEGDLFTRPFAEAKAGAVKQFERSYLERLLRRSESVAVAARAAGLDRSNFRRLLKRHGLSSPEPQPPGGHRRQARR